MTFDHRETGTPETVWQDALLRLPVLTGDARDAGDLVVLAAHPDDETLGAGGLIATAARAGATITVLVASAGEASHPDSPTRSPDELAALRRSELQAALTELAPQARVRWLGLPDGHLAEHGDELRSALRDTITDTTRVVAPYRRDGHPDHDACGEAAADVAAEVGVELLEFPIWLWHWSRPNGLPARCRRVPLDSAAREAKSAALAKHVSQHAPLSDRPGDEAILPPPVLAHFRRPYECFAVTSPAAHTSYFDRLYGATDTDPWSLDGRYYERRKREILLASLPRPRFGRVFEPGAATGALTAELLTRCDEVIAWDVAAGARDRLHERLGDEPGLRVGDGRIPDDWPTGPLDLVVLSEVGYYCADLDALVHRVEKSLSDDGVLVACHWRHPAPDHPHTGDQVHDALGRIALSPTVQHRERDFLLDIWARDGRSVAEREGIV